MKKTRDDPTQEEREFLELIHALPKSEQKKFFRKIFMARNRTRDTADARINHQGKEIAQ